VVFFISRVFVFETALPLRHLNALINPLSGIYKFCPPAAEGDADRILPVGFIVSKTVVNEYNHYNFTTKKASMTMQRVVIEAFGNFTQNLK